MRRSVLCFLLLVLTVSVSAHVRVRKWENVIRGVDLAGAATISTNATNLPSSGTWITVSWETTNTPNTGDTIYVFSPPDVDFSVKAPVKFKSANVGSYIQTGKGSTQFRLVNIRSDYVVVYTQGGKVVAKSDVIKFQDYNEPTQGHLSLTDIPSEMRLKWVTKDKVNPQVKYGTKANAYVWTAYANTSTYTVKDMCASPANSTGWMDPGLIHDAVMTNLIFGQKYYYIYGDTAFSWSSEKSFVAPPAVGASSIDIIAFGDLGKAEADGSSTNLEEKPAIETADNIAKELNEKQYSAVFHIGDISYALGFASQWDSFFDFIEPLATQVPWLVCPGNHEVDYKKSWIPVEDSAGECGIPYFARFNMPKFNLPWYSFNLGPAHFTLMSTEHDFREGSLQHGFIERDLAAVDRSVTPWVIFIGHRPMYISSTNFDEPAGDQPIASLLRQHVEPLLFQYKVDMAWWGHHHSYQRSCPVFNQTCTPGGTVHVVIGMAGQGLSQNIQPVAPRWLTQINDMEYGYTKLSITRSNLHMQFFKEARAVRDDFTMNVRTHS